MPWIFEEEAVDGRRERRFGRKRAKKLLLDTKSIPAPAGIPKTSTPLPRTTVEPTGKPSSSQVGALGENTKIPWISSLEPRWDKSSWSRLEGNSQPSFFRSTRIRSEPSCYLLQKKNSTLKPKKKSQKCSKNSKFFAKSPRQDQRFPRMEGIVQPPVLEEQGKVQGWCFCFKL